MNFLHTSKLLSVDLSLTKTRLILNFLFFLISVKINGINIFRLFSSFLKGITTEIDIFFFHLDCLDFLIKMYFTIFVKQINKIKNKDEYISSGLFNNSKLITFPETL